MGDRSKHKCLCEDAVRYTYHKLRAKDYNQMDALESAYEVLRHHHPEIREEEIPSKVFSMLIEK